ncbi:hypothetical protein GCK72_019506 [Caenorhabditis remanei]|uniref:C-type lectin domain-containing protein n=1 Tax=Caenorhabditis remanei TaxID=31234 RepID=A0A6A5GE95_CAERE|nr:hypothetical protein GCK72_019506 [Caenorhabditis remanei]KAF1752951.1 hypothetical protein GCK72_019506 [Caenorhabditis remanei]
MKFFELSFGSSRLVAENVCIENNSKLSGVANSKETLTGDWDGAWLDGERKCDTSEPNCHNYTWSDGYTIGNEALANNLYSPNNTATKQSCLTVFAEKGPHLNAVSCTNYKMAVGVMCGYQLI